MKLPVYICYSSYPKETPKIEKILHSKKEAGDWFFLMNKSNAGKWIDNQKIMCRFWVEYVEKTKSLW